MAAAPTPRERERRRGRRLVRYAVWGTVFFVALAIGGVAAIDLFSAEPVSALWYGWAVIAGVTAGLGLTPLIALAQDDGEETRLRREESQREA